ncbi:MAG: bifunctional diaminohydroxyphosphoribosylaminopyrimidine deaminase/5-amino-6-(5-phosphoribosylamino)uracil reductase RibD [Pseudomonadota bacterium]
MARALDLARRGLGNTWPNPAVGCVLVRDGTVVGEGWTQPGGRPHAEVEALTAAGEAANGATAFVTLEPCAHHGKTGPCARALATAGVAHVITALEDPDPRVAGRGHAMLRDAGVTVETGCDADAAQAFYAAYFHRLTTGRPWVTLKLAMSVDGRIATATGESRWITGPEARAEVHRLRAVHDAVMIGSGTAQADDPMLDVRDAPAPQRQPVRVIADTRARLDPHSRLARTAGAQPVWLLHGAQHLAPDLPHGVTPLAVPARAHLDLPAAFDMLGTRGLTSVLCEGGGTLAAGLIRAGLVQELILFTAGKILGAEGRPGIGALALSALADAPEFALAAHQRVGADLMSVWRASAQLAQHAPGAGR